jgi:predicted signal transduction protein with EAL and GGDEF domain
MPPWKHRRRLVYFTVLLSTAMIVFAALTWRSDTGVATQLIVGGVSLLSITLTAYTGFATLQDIRLWGTQESKDDEQQ